MKKNIQIFGLAVVLTWCMDAIASGPASVPAWENAAALPHALLLPDFSALVRSQGPAVVNVRIFRRRPAETDGSEERQPAPPRPPQETGLGSGFVVAPNGVILTNSHVVAGADKITVRFADKRELPARVIGVDKLTDVAVLKVEAENLPTATLGDSSRLQVGQWVLAIGAPLGLERTATEGIISALGRSLPNDSYVPFIQTDVPINPGNSGGPLFDLDGRVVGINSQIVSSSGGYMGLSFAIPINTAVAVAKQIVHQGHANHGWLGVGAQELTQELAQAYGLSVPRGALLNEIRPGGPADRAGLKTGDIILAMDDVLVVDSADLPPMIGVSRPGSAHVLSVLRDGKISRITVQVGELGKSGDMDRRLAPPSRIERLGLGVSDLDAATREVLGLPGGVMVQEVTAGPGADAGIQAGDILLKLGSTPVESVAQFEKLLTALPANRAVPLLVKRQDSASFVTITLSGG